MQPERRIADNLVYWPVITQQKLPANMTQLRSFDELEAKRWREHLIAVSQKRDKQAFHALYLHFAPKIKSFYINHWMSARAEELTNEVFLRVWQKAASYKADKANVSTWIYTIARNLKIDELRKKRVSEVNQEEHEEAAVEDNQEDKVDLGREKSKINAIMKLMNEEQRQVMQKVYFEDKPHSRVAQELDMTLGEVKSRVRSGLKVFREHLGGGNI